MTWLSGILLAACVACGDPGPATSLAGPIACGGGTCRDGQVCLTQYGGIDGGPGSGPTTTCVDVPDGCRVFDCVGDCEPCVVGLCAPGDEGANRVSVAGRDLSCPGA